MARPAANTGLVHVDLIAFLLGFAAYGELVQNGQPGASDEVLKKAGGIIQRPDMLASLDSLLAALQQGMEQSNAKPQAILNKMSLLERLQRTKKFMATGALMPDILTWYRSHAGEIRDILNGPAASSVSPLYQIAAMGSPIQRLKALGEFQWKSTIQVLRRWVLESALPSLDLGPAGVRAVAADVAATQPFVEAVRSMDRDLQTMDPDSEEAAEMNEQRSQLTEDLNQVVEESADPQAVGSAAAAALVAPSELEAIAREYNLDIEQAAVLLTDGDVLVNAGAGSGKTTTLNALIKYLIRQGYSPDSIQGSTFTNKAMREFNERMVRNGIQGVDFSTSHTLCRRLILDMNPRLKPQLEKSKERSDALFDIAVIQVGLRPDSGGGASHNYRMADIPVQAEDEYEDEETGQSPPQDLRAELQALIAATGWDILRSFLEQYNRGRRLSEKQMGVIDKARAVARAGGGNKSRSSWGGGKTPYRSTPVNQWFNIGRKPPYPNKTMRTQVGLWQNNGISWEKAWEDNKGGYNPDPDPTGEDKANIRYFSALAYAAYVWLKKNDPQFGPVLDFDDWLGKAVELLKANPDYLARLQARFKVVIVDETQDNNMLQWDLFGMLAAKSDRFVVVGDDRQSIFKFRGAQVGEFIDKAKTFKVLQIGTNYRSGSSIVDAAERLIEKNESQLKKTCKAHRSRGSGNIEAQVLSTHDASAEWVAADIESQSQAGTKISDFGILVRNRAEMDAYALQLMSKGIPFVCDRDPISGLIPKTMLAWVTLATASGSTDRQTVNDAVMQAHKMPGFMMDHEFAEGMKQARGYSTQLEALLTGYEPYSGKNAWRNKNVRAYADAILDLRQYKSTADIMSAVLQIRGAGKTPKSFLEVLKADIDMEDLELGSDLSPDEVDEAVQEAALLPIQPLLGVAKALPNPEYFVAFVEKLRRANDKNKKNEDSPEPAVRIGTVHSWKGLEAPQVYVTMAPGVFPSPRAKEAEEVEEERRLAYVAVTRGKDRTVIMSPKVSYKGPGRGKNPPPPMSPFVAELCIPILGDVDPKDLEGLAAEEEIAAIEEANASGGPGDRTAGTFRRLVASLEEEKITMPSLVPEWSYLV